MYRRRIVSRMVRRHAGRSRSGAATLPAAAACALVLALTGCGRSSETSGAGPGDKPASTGSTYTLMQMNLCLSGLADCDRTAHYPAVVGEAMARIRGARPDAITFNEACETDAARIAPRTGYHARFSRVPYRGALLGCVHPGGRGLFGDAVLTKDA